VRTANRPGWIKSLCGNSPLRLEPLAAVAPRRRRSVFHGRCVMVSAVQDKNKGSWWRLTASILAVICVTVGFGYYLPLRQANQLLSHEFDKVRKTQTQLEETLTKTAAELKTVTDERDTLRDAEAQRTKLTQQARERVTQLMATLPALGQTAIKSGGLQLTAEENTLLVDVFDTTWITPGSDGLARNGNRVLCPFVTDAAKVAQKSVVVRSFAPESNTGGESRWAKAARLSSGVAEHLVARCKADTRTLSVASSSATRNSPLLRLEFHL
jgi:hypothetical protein